MRLGMTRGLVGYFTFPVPRLVVGALPNPKALRLSMEGLRIGFVMSRSYIFCSYIFLCVLE
jgi:hypothetical protein